LSSNNKSLKIVPFLKWPGGKRWFVSAYSDLIPTNYNNYVEPFLGAGSLYFHMQPERALLGDINAELINTYQAIKDDWRSIENSLLYHQRFHSADAEGYYYSQRDNIPSSRSEQASRLIYLNRTCFNGIYRVNLSGKFNVPRGDKNKVVIETDDFKSISNLLARAELISGDFEPLIEKANKNDLVFCDPPYTISHNNNGFLKYNEILFSWVDQERLAAALRRAANRGAKVLCTNANHHSIFNLYDRVIFDKKVVSRASQISAKSQNRRRFEELIIRANI